MEEEKMFACVLFAAVLAAPQVDSPFSELAYEEALEKATSTGKLLLVDFTASWCQPCKRMEKETWGNADVRAWLGEHAFAIQVDVDKQSDLAKRFEIEAMPTVVALREGLEFDRIVGYRDAKGFLGWGRDVLAGKRTSDELKVRAVELRDSKDVDARYDLARSLLRAKQYEQALEHYIWLWPATREAPGMGGVRLSFMLSDMAELAKKHEPARKAFMEILEGLQAKVDAADVPEFLDWQEWSSLCEYFGERARILAWYEKWCDDQGRLFAGKTGGFRCDHVIEDVFDQLMDADRPLDAVRLYEDARGRAGKIVADYRRFSALDAGMDEEMREQMADFQRRELTENLTKLFAALLATGREAEAADVAGVLLQTLDTPDSRKALVRAGLDMTKRPQASFGRWLDEAEAAGANVRILRRRLDNLQEGGETAKDE
jgi:thiol-disulfide isomerase/thioredoxin